MLIFTKMRGIGNIVTRGKQLEMKVVRLVKKIERVDRNEELYGKEMRLLVSEYNLLRNRCDSHGIDMNFYDSRIEGAIN